MHAGPPPLNPSVQERAATELEAGLFASVRVVDEETVGWAQGGLNGNGPINHLHLVQAATVPPTHEYLYIWNHRFPWIITVRSTHSNGILVSDVLGTIYTDLMTPITSRDYYNVDMTAEDRERVEAAYKRRCNGDVGLLKRGILRVDFLGEYVGFTGLVRSWNGMWEMRTVDVTVRDGEREEEAGSLESSDLSAST
ncbi:hypothetical protein MD484_g4909, partial [Candolleomyces efflorescens]